MDNAHRPATPDSDRLTPALVIDRALHLADSEGLAAVSIRRLARECGVTPMALYWHFDNKDALLTALANRVFADVDLALDESPWPEQLRRLLLAMVIVVDAHPAAAALLASCSLRSEPLLRLLEVTLDILRRAGFSPSEATSIARYSLHGILTETAEEAMCRSQRDSTVIHDAERQARALLEKLPSDHYPRIIEAAMPLTSSEPSAASSALSIEILIGGLQALVALRHQPCAASQASKASGGSGRVKK